MKPMPEFLRTVGDRLCCVALAAVSMAALSSVAWLFWDMPMPR
jgi:hypothetical protein